MDLVALVGSYLTAHPKLMAAAVTVLIVHTAVKAMFDSLVSSRAQWDQTPLSDDTWYEKALTWSVRILALTGKVVAYIAGFRPKK